MADIRCPECYEPIQHWDFVELITDVHNTKALEEIGDELRRSFDPRQLEALLRGLTNK